MSYDASAYSGTILAKATVETTTTYSTQLVDSYEMNDNAAAFGGLGLLLGVAFIGMMATIGIWNPFVSIFLSLFGLVGLVVSGLWTVSYYPLISLIIAGLIIAFKGRT